MSAELQQTKLILNTLTRIRTKALEMGRRKTTNGEHIDEHQVHTERLAYLATEVEAAAAALDYAVEVDEAGADHNNLHAAMALGFTAEVAQKYFGQITAHTGDYGFNQEFLDETFGDTQIRAAIEGGAHESRFRKIGETILPTKGVNNSWLQTEVADMTRQAVRQFARSKVAPIAERVHRANESIPESIIKDMSALGYFGMSVPFRLPNRIPGPT